MRRYREENFDEIKFTVFPRREIPDKATAKDVEQSVHNVRRHKGSGKWTV